MPKDGQDSSSRDYERSMKRRQKSSSSRKVPKRKHMPSSSVDSRQRKYYKENISKKYFYEQKMAGKRLESPKNKKGPKSSSSDRSEHQYGRGKGGKVLEKRTSEKKY